MSEEEARAERKRRQQRAQEEFRRQLGKHNQDEKPEQRASTSSSSFDKLLLDIPTQDIEIEQTGNEEAGKRKSPGPDTNAKRRASVINRLDIVSVEPQI